MFDRPSATIYRFPMAAQNPAQYNLRDSTEGRQRRLR